MADKRLVIHPEALEEFKTAVSWYLARSESAAHNFVSDVDQAVELILESPLRWPVFDYQTRRFVLRRFPFAIVYREKETAIQILAVAHGRRRPGYWKKRR
jgi:plasmid stabilization system protein ParE